LILVGGDGREDGLWENVGAELFALQVDDGTGVRFEASDQVHARLVPMHRIQNNLIEKRQKARGDVKVCVFCVKIKISFVDRTSYRIILFYFGCRCVAAA
jgi:hypothetical protein